MTELQARREGLSFTGIYNSAYKFEKVKEKAKAIRAKGFRAVTCSVTANKYSRSQRSGIVGYSVYAEEAYFLVESIESLKEKVQGQAAKLQRLLIKQLEERQELDKEFERQHTQLADLQEKLNASTSKRK